MIKDEIVNIVCEVCGATPVDLARKTKERHVTTAKHLVAHYLWRYAGYSIRQAAQVVRLKPQTLYEVVHPADIAARRESDEDFNELCGLIEAEILTKNKPLTNYE